MQRNDSVVERDGRECENGCYVTYEIAIGGEEGLQLCVTCRRTWFFVSCGSILSRTLE